MAKIRIRPELLEEEQQHRLGLTSPDQWGDEWSYVQFTPGTYNRGHIVADQPYGDIADGTLTAAAGVGTFTLQDTGEFSSDDFRGAIGHIHDGAGQGQRFIVQRVMNADTLRITLFNGQGWATALATGSLYRLVLPGRVELATAVNLNLRGTVQSDNFTVPTSETRHGWVKKTGLAECLRDNSGTDIPSNGAVVATTGGLIIGASDIDDSLGVALLGNPTEDTADFLLPVDLRIVNNAMSFRFPKGKEEPYFDVHI